MKIVGEIKLNLNNIVYDEHNISLPCNSKLMNDGLVEQFISLLQNALYKHSLVGGYKDIMFKEVYVSAHDESILIIPFFTNKPEMSFYEFYENAVQCKDVCVMTAIRSVHNDLKYRREVDSMPILHIDMYTSSEELHNDIQINSQEIL